ncbi:arylalkylamine N-acetyltransferase-like 2 [Uranotaenia lowii]|uniref:arylalkylamine N-acetyltransferase-like 2 n=1 Tax=Uranotaenia lowii TaxID=190385 RepID=UPI002479EB44|nr:arylalkylamine N-acetyltransferase-like 2 [Uranotaenia lowii]
MFSMNVCRRMCSIGASINQRAVYLHQNAVVKPHQKAILETSVIQGIRYRQATQADRELLREGLKKYFYPDDPFTNFHYSGSAVDPDDMECALGIIDTGLMILAVDEETGELGGFAGSSIIGPDEPTKFLQLASEAQTKKFADIHRLLAHIAINARICERFGVDKAYYFSVTGVNPKFRRNAIATKLQLKHFQLAHLHGINVICVDCTNPASALAIGGYGMECVFTMKYADFKDDNGRVLFNGTENCTELKTYAMRI